MPFTSSPPNPQCQSTDDHISKIQHYQLTKQCPMSPHSRLKDIFSNCTSDKETSTYLASNLMPLMQLQNDSLETELTHRCSDWSHLCRRQYLRLHWCWQGSQWRLQHLLSLVHCKRIKLLELLQIDRFGLWCILKKWPPVMSVDSRNEISLFLSREAVGQTINTRYQLNLC